MLTRVVQYITEKQPKLFFVKPMHKLLSKSHSRLAQNAERPETHQVPNR